MTTDELRRMVEQIARKILGSIKPDVDFLKANGIGITLFAFTFKPGALAYVSTAERSDMLGLIKEWVALQEAGLTTELPGPRGVS